MLGISSLIRRHENGLLQYKSIQRHLQFCIWMCRHAVLLADRAGLVPVSSWSHLSQLGVGSAASSIVSSAAQELWAAAHTAGWSGAGWLLVTAPVESQHSHRKGEP